MALFWLEFSLSSRFVPYFQFFLSENLNSGAIWLGRKYSLMDRFNKGVGFRITVRRDLRGFYAEQAYVGSFLKWSSLKIPSHRSVPMYRTSYLHVIWKVCYTSSAHDIVLDNWPKTYRSYLFKIFAELLLNPYVHSCYFLLSVAATLWICHCKKSQLNQVPTLYRWERWCHFNWSGKIANFNLICKKCKLILTIT